MSTTATGIAVTNTGSSGTGSYGSEEAAMQAYLREGERKAFALGNRGPIRFDADGKLAQDILDAYWRCGFYVFEGVLKPDELADIERRHQDHPRSPAGREGRARRQARPAGARRRLQGANLVLVEAARRSVRRHRPRQRPPSREDVRAEGCRRRAQGGRLPDPGLAAVLGSVPAGLRPSRPAGRRPPRSTATISCPSTRRCSSRSRAAAPRSPGTRTAPRIGTARLGRGHARLQLHGPALRLHGRQRRVGRAGLAQARQDRHQDVGRRGRHASGCPRPCRSSASRATSRSPTGSRCTARSPTPARTGG